MKRLLIILAVALTAIAANADVTETRIFYWYNSAKSSTYTAEVGSIEQKNGTNSQINISNKPLETEYKTICLNGKKANIGDEDGSDNAAYILVTPTQPLQVGDVIKMTAYRNKKDGAGSSAYLLFSNNATKTIGGTDGLGFNNLSSSGGTPDATAPNELTYTITEAEAGATYFKMTRDKAGTKLYITKLEIVTTSTTGGGETVEKSDVTLSFADPTTSVNVGAKVTNAVTSSPAVSGISYSSSNIAVATVDSSTGEVEGVSVGTATITARFAGNDSYKSASANYTINVTSSGGSTPTITEKTVSQTTANYWDFSETTLSTPTAMSTVTKVTYGGMQFFGGEDDEISRSGFSISGTTEDDTFGRIEFTPTAAGKLTVLYKSDEASSVVAVGTSVATGTDVEALLSRTGIKAAGDADATGDIYAEKPGEKAVYAENLSAGTKYYIYSANGPLTITKMFFTPAPTGEVAHTHVNFDASHRYSHDVISSCRWKFKGNTNDRGFNTFDEKGENKKTAVSDYKFDYVPGLVAKAIIEAVDYYKGHTEYADSAAAWFYSVRDYAKNHNSGLSSTTSETTLDNLNATKMYFKLLDLTQEGGSFANSADESFFDDYIGYAVNLLKKYNNNSFTGKSSCIESSIGAALPYDATGGWFHKPGDYPYQMWCDGQYMGPALLAQLINYDRSLEVSGESDWDIVAKQFKITWNYLWDDSRELLWHAFTATPDSKTNTAQYWAGVGTKDGVTTYHSAETWGRAAGWYFLALVDVLEQMQIAGLAGSADYNELRGYLNKVAAGLAKRQDAESGCWYQLLAHDGRFATNYYNNSRAKGKTLVEANFLESSATAIFIAAYLKGMRLGLYDTDYSKVAKDAYKGFVERFLVKDNKNNFVLIGCSKSAGLGNTKNAAAGEERFRDGSAEYYLLGYDVIPTSTKSGDFYTEGKVLGAFIMAATEYERMFVDKQVFVYNTDGTVTTAPSTDGLGKNQLAMVVTEEATGKNVIAVRSDGSKVCSDLDISDEAPIFLPTDFTADAASYSREIKNADTKWGTLCLPFQLKSDSKIKYYEIKEVADGTMTVTPIEGTVAAGTPVIFKRLSSGDVSISESGVNVVSGIETAGEGTLEMKGTYQALEFTDPDVLEKTYVISSNQFKRSSLRIKVNPFRAYFVYNAPAAGARPASILISDEETATALNSVFGNDEGGSIEGYYDEGGVRHSSLQDGMNIVRFRNGRTQKILVK